MGISFLLAKDWVMGRKANRVSGSPTGAAQEGDAAVAVAEEVKKNNHVVRKLEKRQQICTLDQHIEE
ncbi:unnamed protein product [Prunus armeniaca]|uniref:Uncharacterized protein n=1 Tax=Prunus armeniaca TaxID=36596 RepID=A0A6J5UTP1_PRUAR|nr:unnamed protein product [Prunus armeniaca]CAB4308940.1 unnamed protein product [Prunus armeniaca]